MAAARATTPMIRKIYAHRPPPLQRRAAAANQAAAKVSDTRDKHARRQPFVAYVPQRYRQRCSKVNRHINLIGKTAPTLLSPSTGHFSELSSCARKSLQGNCVMSLEVSIADLESDIGRLRAERAEFVEQRARTWSRWGTDPFVETTGRRLADLDRRMNELSRRAAAMRKRERTRKSA